MSYNITDHAINKVRDMKKTRSAIIVLFCTFLLSGCFMHTVKGKSYYFPPGAKSDNAEYRLGIAIHGAKRKAFVERTKKKVFVGIYRGKKEIFSREYEVTASGLTENVSWEKLDDLKITFFDFDEGISLYKRATAYKSGKVIFMLHLTYDKETEKFIEHPISDDLKRKIQKKDF